MTLQSGEYHAESAWAVLASHGVGIGGKMITLSAAVLAASLLDRLLYGGHTILDVILARKGVLEEGEDHVRASVIRARATMYSATILAFMFGSSF